MSACPDREPLLHAMIDGELDAANALALEAHLKQCDACSAELRRLQALRRAVAAPETAHLAPAALRASLMDLVDEAASPAPSPARQPLRPVRRPFGWALGGVGGALAAGLAAVVLAPMFGPSLQDELIADHVRSTLAGHLTDIQTSQQHVVRPWFNGKIDFSPPVVDLADQGFLLAGGRLDYADRQVVAALVYRRRLHLINLFVWPSERAHLRPSPLTRREGYSLVHWRAGGLDYWAVSDIDRSDLDAFRRAFVARTAPARPGP